MPDLVLAIAASAITILFLREFFLRRALTKHQEKVLESERQQGQLLVEDAAKRSQQILSEAELESVRIVTDNKTDFLKLQTDFHEKMLQVITELEHSIQADILASRERVGKTEQLFNNYVGELSGRLNKIEQGVQGILQGSAEKTARDFEETLKSSLSELEQKSLSSLDEELSSARAKIEEYQKKRLTEVEKNLVAVLERTLALVLSKRLSLSDHTELVYEAFQKAKEDSFIQ
jgi:hypothetical protein